MPDADWDRNRSGSGSSWMDNFGEPGYGSWSGMFSDGVNRSITPYLDRARGLSNRQYATRSSSSATKTDNTIWIQMGFFYYDSNGKPLVNQYGESGEFWIYEAFLFGEGITSNREGGYVIEMKRVAVSPNSTVSEFTAYGPAPLKPVTGYILEPGGPSTTTVNQDKRIPAGTYSVDPYSSTKYSNHYIVSNSYVSQDRRILIHSGNYHSHTFGCLLPGSSYSMVSGNYVVWNSGATLNSLRSLIGRNSATLNIYDINTTRTFSHSNW